jgi:poly-gamma-glutamate synthesis protein (capsule biosynthesis protein)
MSMPRRAFLRRAWCAAMGLSGARATRAADAVSLFLCGDVVTGRGIDQILPHPSDPVLYEGYVRSALGYVRLAEAVSGPIPRPAAFDYIWGEALDELARRRPDARIVNLETAVTASAAPWPKGINYRMNPRNLPCLQAAGIDACVLSNNHVLDWGREGLDETLRELARAGIRTAGAGAELDAARAPAELPLRAGGRVLLFAAATPDCGVPDDWAAEARRSGVQLLRELSMDSVKRIAAEVRARRRAGDIVVYSIHWGGNWGYEVPAAQREFAHALIEQAGVDVVHGHSAHHVKAIEVHRERLILYGCGDFIDDYEGIEGHAEYRGDLGLMFFPKLDAASGRLLALDLVPTHIRRFRIERPEGGDRRWLLERLRRECRAYGSEVEPRADGALGLRWK